MVSVREYHKVIWAAGAAISEQQAGPVCHAAVHTVDMAPSVITLGRDVSAKRSEQIAPLDAGQLELHPSQRLEAPARSTHLVPDRVGRATRKIGLKQTPLP